MKKLLICPSERPAFRLPFAGPLATVPLLGQSLLEYWLTFCAATGVEEVYVLAHGRVRVISALAGDGARWGLKVKVIEESRELTPAQALIKYTKEFGDTTGSQCMAVLDHFPGFSKLNLFGSYAEFYQAVSNWMEHAATPDRVGIQRRQPGVWVGWRSIISPEAQLEPPCWIGSRVSIGPGAIIGAGSIIEDGCFVQANAEIRASYVAPHTFVGKFAELRDSIAWGNQLVDWKSGSEVMVPDPFLLSALRRPRMPQPGLISKLNELYARNKEDVQMIWKHLLMNKEG